MERLDRRLAEAAAALATLDELAAKNERTLVERDDAVLPLIYSHEAVWKSCQKVLAARENVQRRIAQRDHSGRPRSRVAIGRGAQAAIKLGQERNLAVQMYRNQVGQRIEGHLAAHPALLRRWLEALQMRTAAE